MYHGASLLLIEQNYMTQKSFVLTLASLAASSSLVLAHHGRDFLVVEDAHIPAPGAAQALLNFEWEKSGSESEFGLEPGFIIGVLPQVALGLEASFRDEADEGWDYNSIRPNLHIGLTPSSWNLPFKAALSASYQFVSGGSGGEGEAESEHVDHDHEHADEHEHEHAAEASGHDHGFVGIHNHDDDLFTIRLAVETNLTDSTRLVGNVIGVFPDGGSASWGYAAGIRQTLTSQVALGLEAVGDFDTHGWQELVGAVYFEPISALTVKLGAGFGLNDESPDFILRAGLNWRF